MSGYLFCILFFISNSLGRISYAQSSLSQMNSEQRLSMLAKSSACAILILGLHMVFGAAFLQWLNIPIFALALSGGIILLIIALNMLFPDLLPFKEINSRETPNFLIPFTVPILSPLAGIAFLVSYPELYVKFKENLLSVIFATIASAMVLYFSPFIHRFLRPKGAVVLQKLTSLVLLLISLEMITKALKQHMGA